MLQKILHALSSWTLKLFPLRETREEIFKKEEKFALETAQRVSEEYYQLEDGQDFKDVTEKVLESNDTTQDFKQHILDSGRRFIVFKYPSDSFQVKGILSFVPDSFNNPLLIFLRGGNRLLSLPDPTTDYLCVKNYTILTTTYRGGVSEGNDEYGGDEVNDVDHMMTFFPHLQEKIGIYFNPSKFYMLGASRGGMEMFLSLSRFPALQNLINKAASLSGLLDLKESLRDRPDLKEMFINDFGLLPNENEEAWIRRRNPIDSVTTIRSDLPFLIIQGTNDLRVKLNEGNNMVKKLKKNGNPVVYIEIPGGNHCLRNQEHRMDLIADWFDLEYF